MPNECENTSVLIDEILINLEQNNIIPTGKLNEAKIVLENQLLNKTFSENEHTELSEFQ